MTGLLVYLGIWPLSPIAISLEVEPQLEDPVGELATEAMSVRVLPLPVYNLKGNVLVWRASMEPQNPKVFIFRTGFKEVLRGGTLVNQVRVENVELVTLDDLGWRVVEVVMRLVVFVPFEACVDSVEEARFPGAVFVGPQVHFTRDWELHAELSLIIAHALSGATYEGVLGTLIGITWRHRSQRSKRECRANSRHCEGSRARLSGCAQTALLCCWISLFTKLLCHRFLLN